MNSRRMIIATALLASVALCGAEATPSGQGAGKPAAVKAQGKKKAGKAKKMDHWHKRVQEIRAEIKALPPDTTGTIVMLGDSITEQFFRQKQMPAEIDGVIVVNEGISGDQIDRPTSSTGVTYRVPLVRKAKPAVVFVMIGINDFWGGKETPEEVLPQYDKMYKMLREACPDTKFVLQSVLPTSKANAYMNPNVDKLNDHIKQLASESGAIYLDLHPVMEDAKGELKADFTADGVHLNPQGYQVWLKELKKTVGEVLSASK